MALQWWVLRRAPPVTTEPTAVGTPHHCGCLRPLVLLEPIITGSSTGSRAIRGLSWQWLRLWLLLGCPWSSPRILEPALPPSHERDFWLVKTFTQSCSSLNSWTLADSCHVYWKVKAALESQLVPKSQLCTLTCSLACLCFGGQLKTCRFSARCTLPPAILRLDLVYLSGCLLCLLTTDRSRLSTPSIPDCCETTTLESDSTYLPSGLITQSEQLILARTEVEFSWYLCRRLLTRRLSNQSYH